MSHPGAAVAYGGSQFAGEDEVGHFVDEDLGGRRRHDREVVLVVCEAAEIGPVGCGLADPGSVASEFLEVGKI